MARLLGLDLGGTNIQVVVLDEGATGLVEIVASTSFSTEASSGPDRVVERLVEAGRWAIERHGPLVAAGLGVPGLFEAETGVVTLFPNLPGAWEGVPLRDKVAAALGLPVTLINDARAFTLAEGTIGAGRGCRTLICVTLGTGIGGGIMIDGRLHLGAFGVAGEIAHQTVLPDGPICGCGNRGCAEALAKGDALAVLAGKDAPEEVYAGVRAGDLRCLAAVETAAGWLGIALANAVTLLGPDRIVVGGGIMAAGDLALDPIRRALRSRVTLVPVEQIEVVAASLGDAAGAIGAALAASDR